MDVRTITPGSPEHEAALELRNRILRVPLGLSGMSEAERAAEPSMIHLGAFDGARLVGTLMLLPVGDGSVRMRQVAVEPDRQRVGVGTALVSEAERVCRERGFTLLFAHARDVALTFYSRLGYARVGQPFEEVTIVHHRVEKPLTG